MKKKVWIFNHYAGKPNVTMGLRHYNFSKYLIQKDYQPLVFASSVIHNTDINLIKDNKSFIIDENDDIPFVYINTRTYKGNGIKRVLNMIDFYNGLFRVTKNFEKPDVIIASSVHPLTMIAGIKIAKKLSIPCICEVRDLWPESIVAFGVMKRKNPLYKILYLGERWIYSKARKLIFTMEGGKDYIIDQGWNSDNGGSIDISKIYHINNGVDLDTFNENKEKFILDDIDLHDESTFKVVYAGSIRQANNLDLLIDAAKYITQSTDLNIKFLIWGDGDDKPLLEQKCSQNNINNVIFKGKVNKDYIPYIVSHADLNVLNYSQHDIWKYGGSQNKVFEYLAAGKPVLCTITMGYDIITKYNAGKSLKSQTSESIGTSILEFAKLPVEEYSIMCRNALKAAREYDFKKLTDKLIDCIEN